MGATSRCHHVFMVDRPTSVVEIASRSRNGNEISSLVTPSSPFHREIKGRRNTLIVKPAHHIIPHWDRQYCLPGTKASNRTVATPRNLYAQPIIGRHPHASLGTPHLTAQLVEVKPKILKGSERRQGVRDTPYTNMTV